MLFCDRTAPAPGLFRIGPGTAISAADAPNWTISYRSVANDTDTVTLDSSTKTITAALGSTNIQSWDDAFIAKGLTATMLVAWNNGGFGSGTYTTAFGSHPATLAVRSAKAAGLSSNQYRVKFERGTQPVLNAQASQTFDSGSDQKTLTVRNISGQTGAASNNFLVKFARGNQVSAATKGVCHSKLQHDSGSHRFRQCGCCRHRRQLLHAYRYGQRVQCQFRDDQRRRNHARHQD